MTEGLEAVSVASIGKALDAAALRQQTIASNIANANVAGYVRQEVSFEEQLDGVRQEIAESGSTDLFSLASVNPRVVAASTQSGGNGQIELDTEMANMASNALHYQALLKVLAKNYSLLSVAANDGRK